MIILFLLVGFLASIIGALPLGATNIAVINTTLRQKAKQAYKIIITASIAEALLSYYALHYNMMVKDFFATNQWLQIAIALVLLGIGSFLFFNKKGASKNVTTKKNGFWNNKYATGFLLGLLNPPVLVYWLLVYGIINMKIAVLSIESSISILILFFLGVFFGKIFTLHLYSRFSIIIQRRFQNINTIINKVTGSLLFIIGTLQFVKLYYI